MPGYQRHYMRHDTGDEYNWIVTTTYPNWDMIRGDEMDLDAIYEDFQRREGFSDEEDARVEAMFEWAFEGASHADNIYRPVTREE